jgi:aspartyl-tRNA(Asn)/glutamyl-tRNA(Gln) amidotransferase subunit A
VAERTYRDKVEAQIAAIDSWNPHVNAMLARNDDAARRDADAADSAAVNGEWQGLLHGVTIMVKDNIDTAGLVTTNGSAFFTARVPNQDATVVRKLRNAGAVIMGKATLHEFAFGVRSYNPVIGQAKNPYDLTRIPGGSSGGSGIAVATGMADMALGTDTGGSVRIPSSINGISGLRPTVGRVSNHGCFPVSATHDTIGPMARSVSDVARLFAVMAGYDDADPISEPRPLENFLPTLTNGIDGLRIAVPRNYYYDNLDSDVQSAIETAIKTFESLGAKITDVSLEGAEQTLENLATIIYSDACAVHADRLEGQDEKWGAQTIERMRIALDRTSRDYARALRAKETWQRTLARLFQDHDMLLTPTMPHLPPPIEDNQTLYEATLRVGANTYAGALGSLPGLSVPCGVSAGGLPIGMQLEAAWWNEPRLLRAGHAFQTVTDWHKLRPELPVR